MLVCLFRALIMYIFILFIMRIMGKRQIGDMQASEIVVTFLISGIAAIPLQDNGIPLIASIVSIMMLTALEIIISVLMIKVPIIRRLLLGNSVTVISDGKIDEFQMKRVRLSVNELVDALKINGVFNLEDVQYATVETNGQISVLLKPEKRPTSADQVTSEYEKTKLPYLIIEDGSVNKHGLRITGMDINDVDKELKKRSLSIKDVFVMTVDDDRNYYIVEKHGDARAKNKKGK